MIVVVGLLGGPENGEIGFSNLNSQWLVGFNLTHILTV